MHARGFHKVLYAISMRGSKQKWLKKRMDIAPSFPEMLRCSARGVARCALRSIQFFHIALIDACPANGGYCGIGICFYQLPDALRVGEIQQETVHAKVFAYQPGKMHRVFAV
jgi:hypothetical protein